MCCTVFQNRIKYQWRDIEFKQGGTAMCSKNELQTVTQSVIQATLELLADKIYKIILYGSYARGDFDLESDVDIMIILDCSREEIRAYRKEVSRIASRISLANDIEVSLLLIDRQSFEERLDILPFYQNVLKEGIALYG